ncbi:unnamed protein product [Alternaria burnsii]|nr:unnamed protein product [Alternaria burnsii]
MSTGIEEPATPYWLCQYCEKVTKQLTAVIKKGVEHHFQVEHYPNLQALIDGILERRCHLCAVFIGDEYPNETDRPLLMDVSISVIWSETLDWEQCSETSPLETAYISLGFDKHDRTSERVSVVALNYYKQGIRKKNVPPQLLSAFTGSDQSFALIKRWLRTCYTEHCGCCSSSMQFVPTRLLDLGTRDTDDIRLVAGSDIGHVTYAALSYCWGSVPQLVLTSENQTEFKKRVPFESLSRVAQDAATVCRGMSVRYLWIDAMCIMQGPEGDFHQEAGRMEEVYASALFTICAGASADTTEPFLVNRDPLRWTQCHLLEDGSKESWGYIYADYCEFSADVPGHFDLDWRGWCFQELFLSPRSMYFGPRGVHWICRKGTVCDRYQDFEGFRGDEGHDGENWETPKQLYERVVSLGVDISEPETNLAFRMVWRTIREKYSLKELRYQSDKLLALAGVASVIQRKFNARASFGLWLEDFHEELLWANFAFGVSGIPGTRLGIAPSWSWANLGNCKISSSVGYVKSTWDRVLNSVSATIVSLPVVTGFAIPLQDSGYGCNTSIRLSGRLTACVPQFEFVPGHGLRGRLDPKGYPSRPPHKDFNYYQDTDLEENDLYCFLMKREMSVKLDLETGEDLDKGRIVDKCLVLTPVPGSDNLFRRIGTYFEHLDWDQNDGGAPSFHPYMFHGEQEEQEIEII